MNEKEQSLRHETRLEAACTRRTLRKHFPDMIDVDYLQVKEVETGEVVEEMLFSVEVYDVLSRYIKDDLMVDTRTEEKTDLDWIAIDHHFFHIIKKNDKSTIIVVQTHGEKKRHFKMVDLVVQALGEKGIYVDSGSCEVTITKRC